jgi:hypothetical protein
MSSPLSPSEVTIVAESPLAPAAPMSWSDRLKCLGAFTILGFMVLLCVVLFPIFIITVTNVSIRTLLAMSKRWLRNLRSH